MHPWKLEVIREGRRDGEGEDVKPASRRIRKFALGTGRSLTSVDQDSEGLSKQQQ